MPEESSPTTAREPLAAAPPSGGVPAPDPIDLRLTALEKTVNLISAKAVYHAVALEELGETVGNFDAKLNRVILLFAEHTDRELADRARAVAANGSGSIAITAPSPLLSLVPSSEAVRRRWSLAVAGAIVAVVSVLLDRYGLSWVLTALAQ